MPRPFIIPLLSIVAAWLLPIALLCAQTEEATEPAPKPRPLAIAFVPAGDSNFWQVARAGAQRAAADLSTDRYPVVLQWLSPKAGDSMTPATQATLFESAINTGVRGIVVAPLRYDGLVPAIELAARARLPIVALDTNTTHPLVACTVAINNNSLGSEAAILLGKRLNGRGTVGVVRSTRAAVQEERREIGFINTLQQLHVGIELVVTNTYAAPDEPSLIAACNSLLNQHHKTLDAVFTSHPLASDVMWTQLRERGLYDRIALVGVGLSPDLLAAALKGEVAALITQDPYLLGYRGMQAAIETIKGKKVAPRLDTPSILITRETAEQPEPARVIAQFLDPDKAGTYAVPKSGVEGKPVLEPR